MLGRLQKLTSLRGATSNYRAKHLSNEMASATGGRDQWPWSLSAFRTRTRKYMYFFYHLIGLLYMQDNSDDRRQSWIVHRQFSLSSWTLKCHFSLELGTTPTCINPTSAPVQLAPLPERILVRLQSDTMSPPSTISICFSNTSPDMFIQRRTVALSASTRVTKISRRREPSGVRICMITSSAARGDGATKTAAAGSRWCFWYRLQIKEWKCSTINRFTESSWNTFL